MELLFSYGTLQLEAVQMSTFGRRLVGTPDALAGFTVVPFTIDDPAVAAIDRNEADDVTADVGVR